MCNQWHLDTSFVLYIATLDKAFETNQMNYQNVDKSFSTQFTLDGAVRLLLKRIQFFSCFRLVRFFKYFNWLFFLPPNEMLPKRFKGKSSCVQKYALEIRWNAIGIFDFMFPTQTVRITENLFDFLCLEPGKIVACIQNVGRNWSVFQ